jgi:hypothetical protein
MNERGQVNEQQHRADEERGTLTISTILSASSAESTPSASTSPCMASSESLPTASAVSVSVDSAVV